MNCDFLVREMEEVEKVVNFRLLSVQRNIILLDQNHIQPCIFFQMNNNIFSHCSSEKCTMKFLIKEKGLVFSLSVIR